MLSAAAAGELAGKRAACCKLDTIVPWRLKTTAAAAVAKSPPFVLLLLLLLLLEFALEFPPPPPTQLLPLPRTIAVVVVVFVVGADELLLLGEGSRTRFNFETFEQQMIPITVLLWLLNGGWHY